MYSLLSALTEPFLLAMAALGIALVVAWRRGCLVGRARWWIGGLYLLLYLQSVTLTSYLMLGTLEWQYPTPQAWSADNGAIVVLSGAFLPPGPDRHRSEPAPATLMRCWHAAGVYRETHLPVLVSGGPSGGNTPTDSDASQMRSLLEMFDVPASDVLLEDRSFSTYENAVESARILKSKGIENVILVTDARHMPRAVWCFEKQGIVVQAAPCGSRAGKAPPLSIMWLLPTYLSLTDTQAGCREWTGSLWYWLKGRI